MPSGVWSLARRVFVALSVVLGHRSGSGAGGDAFLVADADSGQVLIENEATAAGTPPR